MDQQTEPTNTGITFAPTWADAADASSDEQARQRLAERFPTRKVTKAIEIDLTDAEIADKGRVLAGLEKEIEAAKSLLKEECARLRSEVKVLEARRAKGGKLQLISVPKASPYGRRVRGRARRTLALHRRGGR